jgi:S-adenosylmethionine-diacylglycerol 3-amino-3-carboxypropyl transferase
MAEAGIAARARFDRIRYAQVWEDAEVLIDALAAAPGSTLVSIASAGDNALALLTTDPARVIAVDLSEAQLQCLRLRIEAYRRLQHEELLELMGSRPSERRPALLSRLTADLDEDTRAFWDQHARAIERYGLGGVGKFERYFRIFRRFILPLVHGRDRIERLLRPKAQPQRAEEYRTWNNRRWRFLLRLFFSRAVMGRLGRDPAFFAFAEGDLPEQVACRTRAALVDLDPSLNPYLTWILTGRHAEALPLALRPEHFAIIRSRLDRIEILRKPLEQVAESALQVDGWNLSDIFEYMTPAEHEHAYARLLEATRLGGRLVYWNMMVPRTVPRVCAARVRAHTERAAALHRRDMAFFYRALMIEERIA